MPEPFADPYLDPDTGILRNLVGARTQADLDAAETDLVAARTVELPAASLPTTGDLQELQAIHGYLFQDVYAWAGHLRTVDIAKNLPGAQHFLPWSRIETAAGFVAKELRDEHYLRGLNRNQFIQRFAHHYDQINYLHPFREGNGRTQRVLLTRIAADAGWRLDWPAVTGAANDHACRAAAESGDFTAMHQLLDRITHPTSPSQRGVDAQAWTAVQTAALSFDRPPGTTRPGSRGTRRRPQPPPPSRDAGPSR